MKKLRPLFLFVLTTLLLIPFFPLTASANAPGPNLDGSVETSPLLIALFVFVSIVGIVFTCFVERLIAKPFGLREEYGKQIIFINIVTQIVMRMLQLWLPGVAPNGMWLIAWYVICVIVLEILVFVTEFLVYCRIMRNVTQKHICMFTLSANALSAFGGLLLLLFVI